jgi:hypothetical protein
MDVLLKLILDSCSFLYNEYGFRFVDSRASESFGGDAYLTMARDDVEFCFSRDRGQIFLEISPSKKWKKSRHDSYSFDLIRQLLTGEKEYHALMDKKNIGFLRANIDSIIDRFSDDKVSTTLVELKKLEHIRMKSMFKS